MQLYKLTTRGYDCYFLADLTSSEITVCHQTCRAKYRPHEPISGETAEKVFSEVIEDLKDATGKEIRPIGISEVFRIP
ncbi:MAG: hypothetical protein HDQ88_03295 [Clostridia bacterium]|nr:hypothetical protein [Clostridia bacterium]